MNFRKYDHVERFGHRSVEGIDVGKVYVFPKLDGTNASIWWDDKGIIRAGSRRRQLTLDKDNAGFYSWVLNGTDLEYYIPNFSNQIIYGEWLVPHTLKTYREDAWRRFWVFDVFDVEKNCYLPYEDYVFQIGDMGLNVIEPLCIINNPSEDQLRHQVELNTYLISDGAGVGEGIVIKNYDWKNQYGRQPWAKIIRNEFKEQNRRSFGTTEKNGAFQVEVAIAEKYITPALVAKTRAKILNSLMNEYCDMPIASHKWQIELKKLEEEHRGKVIPRLLQTVYTDLISEEGYSFIKEFKDPIINFKKLRNQCIRLTKEYAADLF